MADLLPLAASRNGGARAVIHPAAEGFREISYADLHASVRELALGLLALGIAAEDPVAILADTRIEWTLTSLALTSIGAITVSIYPTSSTAECRYVLEHSGARAVVVEGAEQLAKVRTIEHDLPALELVMVMEAAGVDARALSLDAVRAAGHGRPLAELDDRVAAVGPEDTFLYIYTSGTTGPPKGCVLSHANYRAMVSMVEAHGLLDERELVYLFLPLAHAFALLVQFIAFDTGGTVAYWRGDAKRVVDDLQDLHPTLLPAVPRIFEKVRSAIVAKAEGGGRMRARLFWWSIAQGRYLRDLERLGARPGTLARARHALADRIALAKVRALFGGSLHLAVAGAAPTPPDLIEFFDACGVPVLEAYGLTESSTGVSVNTRSAVRFGTVGRPFPGVEVRIGDDDEVLVRGANVFQGYLRDPEATRAALVDGWLHTGDFGRLDQDGFLTITGRKKDLIVTAGGKNVTPANLETGLEQSRIVAQAVVVGDRRPYLVALLTLDPDEAARFANAHGLDPAEVAESAALRTELERVVAGVNEHRGRVEQVKRFRVLPHEFTQESGELTATLKVKRAAVIEKHADVIDALYREERTPSG